MNKATHQDKATQLKKTLRLGAAGLMLTFLMPFVLVLLGAIIFNSVFLIAIIKSFF